MQKKEDKTQKNTKLVAQNKLLTILILYNYILTKQHNDGS